MWLYYVLGIALAIGLHNGMVSSQRPHMTLAQAAYGPAGDSKEPLTVARAAARLDGKYSKTPMTLAQVAYEPAGDSNKPMTAARAAFGPASESKRLLTVGRAAYGHSEGPLTAARAASGLH